MKRIVSIIKYHYVRDLARSRYPGIKGLDASLFREQIAYIKKYYNVISAYDLMDAIEANAELPPNALLLTFDDAYIDHFTEVFPVLEKEGLSGSFFAPVKCILEHGVLDVNKIHFILASVPDKGILVEDIFRALDDSRESFALEPNEYYWQKVARQSRYDSADVVFIKRVLQRELPELLRKTITNRLFEKFVTKDQSDFSRQLYMGKEQIEYLQNNNMYIGSHGFDHNWLNNMSGDAQEKEIDLSLQFLESIGSDTSRWIISYPYGAYNDNLLTLLKKRGCLAGLTIESGLADLEKDNPLTLPRLDTNDLPKKANMDPNEWTLKAMKD
jgi:peptidoglycan/xylan/chitin deacetylase (PgdA/CDA1 family)